MRIIVDPNVLISYLLTPFPDRHPARLVHAVFDRRCDLVISMQLLNELHATIRSKPHLDANITPSDLDGFTMRLRSIARIVPDIDEPIPAVTRDPGDDYLVAHAVREDVDYLVSGDKDVLDLGRIGTVKIVNPATFVQILEEG